MKITKQLIESELIEVRQTGTGKIIWCKELRGFGVCISPTSKKYPLGKASYLVKKRPYGRNTRQFKIRFGEYPFLSVKDAKNQAHKIIADIRNGIDVSAATKRFHEQFTISNEGKTLEDVYNIYLKRNSGKDSRYWTRDFPYTFKTYILPILGERKINMITKQHCRDLLAKKQEAAPATARAMYDYMGPLFKFALYEDHISTNPMDGLLPPPKAKRRDRVLTKEELIAYLKATDELIAQPSTLLFGCCFRLLLLTGCRRTEVAGMEWSELDLQNRTWTLPVERCKNDHPHRVYLSDMVLDIIAKVPRTNAKYLFTYTGGRTHISGFGTAKERLDDRMAKYLGRAPNFRTHDVRRTVASMVNELGVSTEVVELCLNHRSGVRGGIAGVYIHSQRWAERVDAYKVWNDYLISLR
jgi:integrase